MKDEKKQGPDLGDSPFILPPSSLSFRHLPFDEAIKFLKDKVNLPSETWTDLWEGMHSRGFVVSGATKNELLVDIHNAINEAIKNGGTLNDFKKNFRKIVAEHGWTGSAKSPITDEESLGWRSATIFNTNMRTAYSAGQYKQMTEPAVLKARKYWRYIGGLSRRPRPLHLQWNGLVLPADDPWWHSHYPPNGWGCKCKVVSMSGREMARDGLKESKRPDDGERDWTNPNTGEVIKVPNGIDPGWAYNPGAAKWGEIEAGRLIDDGTKWKDVDPWGIKAYGRLQKPETDKPVATIGEKVLPGKVAELMKTSNIDSLGEIDKALREALRIAVGGEEVSIKDPIGDVVLISQGIVNHMLEDFKRLNGREQYFPFIPELIEDPYEIWLNFEKNEESGRFRLRKRYVKGLDLGKGKTVSLVAEEQNGLWVDFTFFSSGLSGLANVRKGRLLYGR